MASALGWGISTSSSSGFITLSKPCNPAAARASLWFPRRSVSGSAGLLVVANAAAANAGKGKNKTTATTTTATAKEKKVAGIQKPRRVSPELKALVGKDEISRTEAIKLIWAHIKDNQLQDPNDKKIIICDEKLKKIFDGKEKIGFLEVSGMLTKHFL